MKLVSACLFGAKCTWDGERHKNEKLSRLLKNEKLIYVCPEELGGLETPRSPQEIQNCCSGEDVLDKKGYVMNTRGIDVTDQFIRGAYEALKIAQKYNITEFIGKQRSPSCGSGQIYNGTFTGTIIEGDGVTTALLKRNGIKVISGEDLLQKCQ